MLQGPETLFCPFSVYLMLSSAFTAKQKVFYFLALFRNCSATALFHAQLLHRFHIPAASAVYLTAHGVVVFISISINGKQSGETEELVRSECERIPPFASGDEWKLFLLTLCGRTQVVYYDRADLYRCYAGVCLLAGGGHRCLAWILGSR